MEKNEGVPNHDDEEWGDSDDELESLIVGDDAGQYSKENTKQAAADYMNLEHLEKIKKYLNIIASTLAGFALCFLIFYVAHGHLHQKPMVEVSGLNVVDSLHHDSFETIKHVVGDDYDGSLPIQRIVVLGERNSGLEELKYRLSRCYPDIEVTTHFTRMGYWFQETKDTPELEPLTLVIAVFLNVFDWVDVMRQNPLHAPSHEDMNWQTFVQTPWTMKATDLELDREPGIGKTCQLNFGYEEVVPCEVKANTYQDKHPVYEMKPGGNGVFANILELRDEKIHNFVSTMYMKQVQSFISVKFEDLVLSGVIDLLGRIELASGIHSTCPDEELIQFKPLVFTPTAEDSYFSYIRDNVNWSTERMIGYDNVFGGSPETDDLVNLLNIIDTIAKPESLDSFTDPTDDIPDMVMVKPGEVNDHLLDTLDQTDDVTELYKHIADSIGRDDDSDYYDHDFPAIAQAADRVEIDDDITDLDSPLMNDYFADLEHAEKDADSVHEKIDSDFGVDDDITGLDYSLMNDFMGDDYYNDMDTYIDTNPNLALAADRVHEKINTDVGMDDVITDLDTPLMNDYSADLEHVEKGDYYQILDDY